MGGYACPIPTAWWKIRPFSPMFPLAGPMAEALCCLSLWNVKDKASTVSWGTAFQGNAATHLSQLSFLRKSWRKRPYLHRIRRCDRRIPWRRTKRKGSYHYEPLKSGGAGQNWTDDLLNAIQALSQLSYNPMREEVFSEPWNESQPFFSHSPKTASKAPLKDTPSSPPFLRKAVS